MISSRGVLVPQMIRNLLPAYPRHVLKDLVSGPAIECPIIVILTGPSNAQRAVGAA
jgi:hypothetical protein